jgi:hypothetical protein
VLGVVSAVWLIAQLTTLAVTPAELWLSGNDTCQCAHGADATCPMHHPTSGRHTCVMRSAAPVEGAALNSLVGAGGCVATSPSLPADWLITSDALPAASNLVSRFARPDSPPPRT